MIYKNKLVTYAQLFSAKFGKGFKQVKAIHAHFFLIAPGESRQPQFVLILQETVA